MPETHHSSSSRSGGSAPGPNPGEPVAAAEQTPEAHATPFGGQGVTTTTLTYLVGMNDITIVVGSSAGVAVGEKIRIDDETLRVAQAYLATPFVGTNTIPVLRGQDGTATRPHAAGTTVVIGDAVVDFTVGSAPGQVATIPGATPWSPTISLNAKDTAVPLPTAIGFNVVKLAAGATPAPTLAPPGKDLDGAVLVLMGPPTGSGTVTVTAPATGSAGLSGKTLTITAGQSFMAIASGGNWVQFPSGAAA